MNREDLKKVVMAFCKAEKIKKEDASGFDFLKNFEKRWSHLIALRKTVSLTTARGEILPSGPVCLR